jgi:hypothetical protein
MRESLPAGLVLLLLVFVQWYYVFKASQVIASDSALCEFERFCRLDGGEQSADQRCQNAGPRDNGPNICLTAKARWCRLYPHVADCLRLSPSRYAADWQQYYLVEHVVGNGTNVTRNATATDRTSYVT